MTSRSSWLACIVLLPMAAGAQLAATVPSSDPAYAAIDEVSASLPVSGSIAGQRPWSRREMARVILAFEAEREREQATSGVSVPARVCALVDSLAAAYGADIDAMRGRAPATSLEGMPVRGVLLDVVGTNSDYRAVPRSNGMGSIDAVTNPLAEPNWGRPTADGGTASVESVHELGLGSHVALAVQPRVSWLQGRAQQGHQQADFQRLYARAVLANVGVEVGLDELLWGQAGARGLLLSANPRPLHALTIANDTAITLPWLLRLVGPTRLALMIADLGRDQNFPGAQLVAYKASITPTPRLEVGVGMLDEMGGGGSPRCSVACRVADLFPYVMWMHPASDPLATNKVALAEMRYRIPGAAGLTLTYEGDIDDFDMRRIRSMLWENTAHMLGARFDRLTPDGRLALDVQLHHTPLTLYEHYQYTSGLTYRRAIIGDPLGVHGTAAYGTLTWRSSPLTDLAITAAVESRDPSLYRSDEVQNRYVLVARKAPEDRLRVHASLDRQILGTGFGYSVIAGAERVRNDAFASVGRTNGLAELTLRRRF